MMVALLAMQQLAIAQTVNVHFKNGQVIEYPSDNVDYVDFSAKPAPPNVTVGQVVDLGLSVYWASCNLGAEKPEEYGDYYAWGETKPKSTYTEMNYSYYDNVYAQYINIGNNISGSEYDAATTIIGNDWRTPTESEINELIKNCTWVWMQLNGVNGYMVQGKNGNSLFLPAAGSTDVNNPYHPANSHLGYMTANGGSGRYAHILVKDDNGPFVNILMQKYYGYSVRPVTNNPNAGDGPVNHSQDYLPATDSYYEVEPIPAHP